MPKSLSYTAIPIFGITTVVWVIGVSNHTFLASEFWIYVGMFLVPAGAICASAWLIFRDSLWQQALGVLALLPCLGVWFVSLVLVYNGFRIH